MKHLHRDIDGRFVSNYRNCEHCTDLIEDGHPPADCVADYIDAVYDRVKEDPVLYAQMLREDR